MGQVTKKRGRQPGYTIGYCAICKEKCPSPIVHSSGELHKSNLRLWRKNRQ